MSRRAEYIITFRRVEDVEPKTVYQVAYKHPSSSLFCYYFDEKGLPLFFTSYWNAYSKVILASESKKPNMSQQGHVITLSCYMETPYFTIVSRVRPHDLGYYIYDDLMDGQPQGFFNPANAMLRLEALKKTEQLKRGLECTV